MTWTTEKPTKLGWYWWRRNELPDEMVNVLNYKGGFIVRAYHSNPYENTDTKFELYLDQCSGQWAGPLEPPTNIVEE